MKTYSPRDNISLKSYNFLGKLLFFGFKSLFNSCLCCEKPLKIVRKIIGSNLVQPPKPHSIIFTTHFQGFGTLVPPNNYCINADLTNTHLHLNMYQLPPFFSFVGQDVTKCCLHNTHILIKYQHPWTPQKDTPHKPLNLHLSDSIAFYIYTAEKVQLLFIQLLGPQY